MKKEINKITKGSDCSIHYLNSDFNCIYASNGFDSDLLFRSLDGKYFENEDSSVRITVDDIIHRNFVLFQRFENGAIKILPNFLFV